jgi:hypothetical protein
MIVLINQEEAEAETKVEIDAVAVEPVSLKIHEKIIAHLPNVVGTLGMLIIVGMAVFSYGYEKMRHITSLVALILGACLTVLFFVAELYPYENANPENPRLIQCAVPISVTYMILAAIMYSWLDKGGEYEYYMLWLYLHSYIMLFASGMPLLAAMRK